MTKLSETARIQGLRGKTGVFFKLLPSGVPIGKREVMGKKVEVYNDTVIGFASDGTEIVRVQVEEPTWESDEKRMITY